MYILVSSTNDIVKYPYSLQELKHDNQNISFPKTLDDTILNSFNVYMVKATQPPIVSRNERLQEETPELVDGEWTQVWSKITLTEEEYSEKLLELSFSVREQRNEMLRETDWWELPSQQPISSVREQYRQALRDITSQEDFPFSVTWPTKPE